MNTNINVGCGMSPTKGWKNFDNSWSIRLASKPIVVSMLKALGGLKSTQLEYIEFARERNIHIHWADASKHLPLADNSVDNLYSSHMLEHLDRQKAQSFLKEAKRVIKPGGIIRIVVPDLRLLVDDYIKNGDANEFMIKLKMYKVMPGSLIEKLKYLFVGDRHHQWNYDADSLSSLLKISGFENTSVLKVGSTTISHPGSLDLYERAEQSLYIEAKKP